MTMLYVSPGITDFKFSSSIDEFIVPRDGKYILEVWGSVGGKSDLTGVNLASGGYGGYAVGTATLTAGEILYVCAGGIPYNGGGTGNRYGGSGGGATHIAKANGLLKDLVNNKESVLIVAGGGGGSQFNAGGYGGGLTGGNGLGSLGTLGSGGTQTAGGSGSNAGSFGQGGNSGTGGDNNYGGAGGGGYFGGGGASSDSSGVDDRGGGGGSGYVSATLTNASTIGNGSTSIPLPTGNSFTGNSSTGYARISIVNTAPQTPTNVTISGRVSPGRNLEFSLPEFNDVDGDVGKYIIETSTDGVEFTQVVQIEEREYTYTVPSNISSTNIYFSVQLDDGFGGLSSKWYSQALPIQYNLSPTEPTLTISSGDSVTKGESIVISTYSTDSEGEAITYEVQYTVNNGSYWESLNLTNARGNSHIWNVPLEIEGTKIKFRTRATDGNSYSDFTLSSSLTLNTAPKLSYAGGDISLKFQEPVNLNFVVTDPDPSQTFTVYLKEGINGTESPIETGITGGEISLKGTLTYSSGVSGDANVTLNYGEKKFADIPTSKLLLADSTIPFEIRVVDSIGKQSSVISFKGKLTPNESPKFTIAPDLSGFTLTEGSITTFQVTATDINEGDSPKVVYFEGNGFSSEIGDFTKEADGSYSSSLTFYLNNGMLIINDNWITTYKTPKKEVISISVADKYDSRTVNSYQVSIIPNRPPTITVDDVPKFSLIDSKEQVITGKITDSDALDSKKLSLVASIDGGSSTAVPLDAEGNFSFKVPLPTFDSEVRVIFTASDGKATHDKLVTLNAVSSKIEFKLKEAYLVDSIPSKVSLPINVIKSNNAELKVYVCNNGFDANPTWEDATTFVNSLEPYQFTNTVKTASDWGINLHLILTKNNAPEIAVTHLGIIFE